MAAYEAHLHNYTPTNRITYARTHTTISKVARRTFSLCVCVWMEWALVIGYRASSGNGSDIQVYVKV